MAPMPPTELYGGRPDNSIENALLLKISTFLILPYNGFEKRK